MNLRHLGYIIIITNLIIASRNICSFPDDKNLKEYFNYKGQPAQNVEVNLAGSDNLVIAGNRKVLRCDYDSYNIFDSTLLTRSKYSSKLRGLYNPPSSSISLSNIQVKWFKNGHNNTTKISDGSKNSYKSDDTFLTIDRARDIDSGQYQCSIKNTFGTVLSPKQEIIVGFTSFYDPAENDSLLISKSTLKKYVEERILRRNNTGELTLPFWYDLSIPKHEMGPIDPKTEEISSHPKIYNDYWNVPEELSYVILKCPYIYYAPSIKFKWYKDGLTLNTIQPESIELQDHEDLKYVYGGFNHLAYQIDLTEKHSVQFIATSLLILMPSHNSINGQFSCEITNLVSGDVSRSNSVYLNKTTSVQKRQAFDSSTNNQQPPQNVIIVPPRDNIILLRGQEYEKPVSFTCMPNYFKFKRPYKIAWHHNGKFIGEKHYELNPQILQSRDEEESFKSGKYHFSVLYGLTINDVKVNDAGNVSCQFEIDGIGIKKSDSLQTFTAHLSVIDKPRLVGKPFEILEKDVDGSYLTLNCGAVAETKAELRITWIHNGQPLDEKAFPHPHQQRLVIQNFDLVHEGIFQCFGENLAGSIHQTFWVKIAKYPPQIVVGLHDTRINSGSLSNFTCLIVGRPSPSITWRLNDDSIAYGNETVQLKLPPAKPDNVEGFRRHLKVTCIGANSLGTEMTTSNITLIAPTIAIFPEEKGEVSMINVIIGDNAKIPCVIRHDRLVPIQITWYKIKKGSLGLERLVKKVYREDAITAPVQYDKSKYWITASAKGWPSKLSEIPGAAYADPYAIIRNYALNIRDSRYGDKGMYLCKVISDAGNINLQTSLQITELPYPPIRIEAQLLNPRTGSVKITWNPNFDGNSPIESYQIQYQPFYFKDCCWKDYLVSFPSKTTTTSKPGQDYLLNEAIIRNLTSDTEYYFRVRALNALGNGAWSDHSNSIKIPLLVPILQPRDLQIDRTGSTWINLKWQIGNMEIERDRITGYIVSYKLAGITAPSRQTWATDIVFNELAASTNEGVARYLVVMKNVTNLIAWKEYSFKVKVFNKVGKGPDSEIINAWTRQGVPEIAPYVERVQVLNSTSINVQWKIPDPQMINGILSGCAVRIFRETKLGNFRDPSENTSTLVDRIVRTEGTVLETTIIGLDKFREYSLDMSCFTEIGDGPFTYPRNTFQTKQDVPDPIRNLTLKGTKSDAVKLTWIPSKHFNGIFKGYEIEFRPSIPATSRTSKIYTTIESVIIRNLTYATSYLVKISGLTEAGIGAPTSIIVTSGKKPDLPAIPIIMKISNLTERETLNPKLLIALKVEGNGDLNLFQVKIWKKQNYLCSRLINKLKNESMELLNPKIDQNPSFKIVVIPFKTLGFLDDEDNFNLIQYPIINLTISVRYFSKYTLSFRVKNGVGFSPWSEPSAVIQTPIATPEKSPDILGKKCDGRTCTVVWTSIQDSEWNGLPVGYNVCIKQISQNQSECFLKSFDSNYITLQNELSPLASYEVSIKSQNNQFTKENVSQIRIDTLPTVPLIIPDIRISKTINRSVIINLLNRADEIKEYELIQTIHFIIRSKVTTTNHISHVFQFKNQSSRLDSFEISGQLYPNTKYYAQGRFKNFFGYGNWSRVIGFKTPRQVPEAPSYGVIRFHTINNSATAYWGYISGTFSYMNVDKFQISYAILSFSSFKDNHNEFHKTWEQMFTVSSKFSSYQLPSSLIPNRFYHFRIVALNDIGTSLPLDLTVYTSDNASLAKCKDNKYGAGIVKDGIIKWFDPSNKTFFPTRYFELYISSSTSNHSTLIKDSWILFDKDTFSVQIIQLKLIPLQRYTFSLKAITDVFNFTLPIQLKSEYSLNHEENLNGSERNTRIGYLQYQIPENLKPISPPFLEKMEMINNDLVIFWQLPYDLNYKNLNYYVTMGKIAVDSQSPGQWEIELNAFLRRISMTSNEHKILGLVSSSSQSNFTTFGTNFSKISHFIPLVPEIIQRSPKRSITLMMSKLKDFNQIVTDDDIYAFAVLTQNSVGYSEPSNLFVKHFKGDSIGPLSVPNTPEILKVTKNSISLRLNHSVNTIVDEQIYAFKVKYWTDSKINNRVHESPQYISDYFNYMYVPCISCLSRQNASCLSTIFYSNITIPNLYPFTLYLLQIAFENLGGIGEFSEPALRVTTKEAVPSAPIDLKIESITMTSLILIWKPPIFENGDLNNYKIEYISNGTKVEKVIPKQKRRVLTIRNLLPFTNYEFRIAASNGAGFGEYTHAHVTTGPQEKSPQPPENVSLEYLAGEKDIQINWIIAPTEPENYHVDAVLEILGYYIEVWEVISPDSDPKPSIIQSNSHNTMMVKGKYVTNVNLPVQSLTLGKNYSIRIMSFNGYGVSNYSFLDEPISITPQMVMAIKLKQMTKFYDQWWFLIIVALASAIVIIIVVACLCFKSREIKYQKKIIVENNNGYCQNSMALNDDNYEAANQTANLAGYGLGLGAESLLSFGSNSRDMTLGAIKKPAERLSSTSYDDFHVMPPPSYPRTNYFLTNPENTKFKNYENCSFGNSKGCSLLISDTKDVINLTTHQTRASKRYQPIKHKLQEPHEFSSQSAAIDSFKRPANKLTDIYSARNVLDEIDSKSHQTLNNDRTTLLQSCSTLNDPYRTTNEGQINQAFQLENNYVDENRYAASSKSVFSTLMQENPQELQSLTLQKDQYTMQLSNSQTFDCATNDFLNNQNCYRTRNYSAQNNGKADYKSDDVQSSSLVSHYNFHSGVIQSTNNPKEMMPYDDNSSNSLSFIHPSAKLPQRQSRKSTKRHHHRNRHHMNTAAKHVESSLSGSVSTFMSSPPKNNVKSSKTFPCSVNVRGIPPINVQNQLDYNDPSVVVMKQRSNANNRFDLMVPGTRAPLPSMNSFM